MLGKFQSHDVRPDFVGMTVFRAEHDDLGRFECAFFLPKSELAQMWALVRVASLTANPFDFCWKFSCELHAGSEVAIGEEVFHSGYTEWDWGSGKENTLVGEITRLTVNRGDVGGSPISGARFLVTPSVLLRSADIVRKQDGKAVRVRVSRRGVACSLGGIQFCFASAYRLGIGGKLESSVECETVDTREVREPSRILALLEDVLTLASFAERRVLILTGWTFSRENGDSTTHYRRDFTTPPVEETDIDATLIPLEEIQSFLDTCLPKFGGFPQPQAAALKQAMHFALRGQGRGIGDLYVILFAGIETLLNTSRSEKASFSDRFEAMCLSRRIELADLWPMVGAKGSLYAVRNRIVHGSVFSSDHEWFRVVPAKYHLLWTLERSILCLLEWPVDRSRVSRHSLRGLTLYDTWRADHEYFARAD